MRCILFLFAIMVSVALACEAQAKPSTVETTYGNCSPNMAHNSGNVTIICKGLDPAVASEISEVVKDLSTLNKKTATEKNQQLMIKMLKGMRASVEAAIAHPNGQGDTTIIQNTAGNCSPNIIGDGNTNICGPQKLGIDSEQAVALTHQLSNIPDTITRGKIHVLIEIQDHDTQVAGEALAQSLHDSGLDVQVNEAYHMMVGADNYGGISFFDISQPGEPLAMAIGSTLRRIGVVSGPIPAFRRDPQQPSSPDFTIIVRTPQGN